MEKREIKDRYIVTLECISVLSSLPTSSTRLLHYILKESNGKSVLKITPDDIRVRTAEELNMSETTCYNSFRNLYTSRIFIKSTIRDIYILNSDYICLLENKDNVRSIKEIESGIATVSEANKESLRLWL